MDFAGRVLLLTGASGGIGAAIAQLFYQDGASVLLADVQEAPVRELARALDPSGKRTESIKYDASRPDDATTAVRLCLERFGKIDFLVPDAAIYEDQPFLTMTDEQWRKTLAINLDGVFYICRRAIAVIRPGSAVVNIASDAAHQGSSVEHSHYGTSKGGVLTLTKSLAREHAPNIRVNAVSPGTTDTPMAQNVMRIRGKEILASIPMGRLATAPEIADTVASPTSPGRGFRSTAAHTCRSCQAVTVWPPEWRAKAPAPDGGARLPAAGVSSMGRRQSGRREMEAS